MLGLQAIQPGRRLSPPSFWSGPFSQGQEMRQMRVLDHICLATGLQPLEREFAHCLQHAVAGLLRRLVQTDQALVIQGCAGQEKPQLSCALRVKTQRGSMQRLR
jgi:hypothetical protein